MRGDLKATEPTTKTSHLIGKNGNRVDGLTGATHQAGCLAGRVTPSNSQLMKKSAYWLIQYKDEAAIDVKDLRLCKSDDTMKALAGHHADVEQKFESMNQLNHA